MKMMTHKTVDEYIASFPDDVQKILKELRSLVKDIAPEAEESISYGMPAYKLNGPLVYYAANKEFYSVYVPPPALEVFKDDVKQYGTTKSALQILYSQPVPRALIKKLIEFRAAENVKRRKK